MVVERRDVQMPRRRERLYLFTPAVKQAVAVAPDELRQFVESSDGDISLAFRSMAPKLE